MLLKNLTKAQIKSLIKVSKGHQKSRYKYSRTENKENRDIIASLLELSGYNVKFTSIETMSKVLGLHKDTVGRRVNEAEEEFISLMRSAGIDPYTLIQLLEDEDKPIDRTIYIHTETQALPKFIEREEEKDKDNDTPTFNN